MGWYDEVRAVPKPKFKRRTKKRKDRGRITPQVYAEVWQRDGGRCVICGKGSGEAWTLDVHHIVFRSHGGTGEPHNLALACGPVTQPGTCHWKAHNTRAGRQAFEKYQREVLLPLYQGGGIIENRGRGTEDEHHKVVSIVS